MRTCSSDNGLFEKYVVASLHDVSSHSCFALFRATLHDLQQTMFQSFVA